MAPYLTLFRASNCPTVQEFQTFMKRFKNIVTKQQITSKHYWIDHYLFTWTVYDVLDDINGILDHQNIGVDIIYLVLSHSVLELWCKIHCLVMAEIKMAATATRGRFRDGSISENVQGLKLYKCTKFHACMKKWTIHLKFGLYIMYYKWHS